MKTKVAIFGGSFNPPTTGHVKIAELLLENGFDEVWITPCYKHLHGKELEDPQKRLDMCHIAVRNHKDIHVFDYEIRHKLNGSTFNFISRLMNDTHLDVDITFVMGQDNANTFHRWHRAYELQRMAKFVVVARTGVGANEDIKWYKGPPHIHIDPENKIMECSSTDVREHIHKNGRKTPFPMIDSSVLMYIDSNDLYLNKEEKEKALENGKNFVKTIQSICKRLTEMTK